MSDGRWEFDIDGLTVRDLILLEDAGTGNARMRDVRDLLARLVTNRTSDEIEDLTIGGLRQLTDALSEAIQEEIEIPKGNSIA